MTMAKLSMTIKCPLSAGRCDGHGGPAVQYKVHLPMKHVQGYTQSHWTPPLDNYSLHIALAATKAMGNTATMKKCTHFAGHFGGCGSASVQYRPHHPIEAVQGFT